MATACPLRSTRLGLGLGLELGLGLGLGLELALTLTWKRSSVATSFRRSAATRSSKAASHACSLSVRIAPSASLSSAIRSSFWRISRSCSTLTRRITTRFNGSVATHTSSPPVAATPSMR